MRQGRAKSTSITELQVDRFSASNVFAGHAFRHGKQLLSTLRHSSRPYLLFNLTNMPFAQLVIGPPGAGKSTYCDGMHQFLTAINRKCAVVNLDPANDKTSYPCALDIRDLVSLEEVMEQEELGPNGGVMYALEELQENFEWLEEGLKDLSDSYILFDCPGQVELFTHHNTMPALFHRLEKIGYRVRHPLPS
jgi:GTPase SAR1 family protein